MGDTTYVIVVRDPDYENEFTIVGPARVRVIEIDLGRADLSDPDELAAWLDSHERRAGELRDRGDDEAADAYHKLVLGCIGEED
jgi:hypothetical protein